MRRRRRPQEGLAMLVGAAVALAGAVLVKRFLPNPDNSAGVAVIDHDIARPAAGAGRAAEVGSTR